MNDKNKLEKLRASAIDKLTHPGMTLAKRIEQLFKDKCAKFKKDYKLNFGVYYTPQGYQWAA